GTSSGVPQRVFRRWNRLAGCLGDRSLLDGPEPDPERPDPAAALRCRHADSVPGGHRGELREQHVEDVLRRWLCPVRMGWDEVVGAVWNRVARSKAFGVEG